MTTTSSEEPKAPIVRIRKKKTKKKSKENDIVHLPVRASQQTRYSVLSTPTNPQTKSRECCRHFFAGCLKIPVCRVVCFRCILPQCYKGEGSDNEDEEEARDEGYHSQNRSSELATIAEPSHASVEHTHEDIEMTEVKTETATLIPPPRSSSSREYRRSSPRSSVNSSRKNTCQLDNNENNGEITYIEIESVNFSTERGKSTKHGSFQKKESSGKINDKTDLLQQSGGIPEEGYEEPILVGDLGEELSVDIERELQSRFSTGNNISGFGSGDEFNISTFKSECDNDSDGSETKYYVNEDVLKLPAPPSETLDVPKLTKISRGSKKDRDYANMTRDGSDKRKIEKSHSGGSLSSGKKMSGRVQHQYVNFSSNENKQTVSETGSRVLEGKSHRDSRSKKTPDG